jgi:subtilisin family serine protease
VVFRGANVPAEAAAIIASAGGELVYRYDNIGVVVARSDNADFRANLLQDNRVDDASATTNFGLALSDEEAEVSDVAETDAVPLGDPLSGNQWDMLQIHVPEAHAITTGSPTIVVGDLDTGLDYTHPDLLPNINFAKSVSCVGGVPNQDPAAWADRRGHGTHTAGTIAAAKNGIGVVGVAPNVQIAGIKVSTDGGMFYPEAVVCGFVWAAEHGIDITNNSYFADPWWMNCRNDPTQQAIWKAESRAIRYAISRGVTVVASAGNDATDLSHPTVDTGSPGDGTPITREVTNACLVIPSEVPGVITVSANGYFGLKAGYSNYGMGRIQVSAPGGDNRQIVPALKRGSVLSTYPGGRYAWMSGTSMASPHIAGVAALVMSQYGKLQPGQLQAVIQNTAEPMSCPTDANTTCAGGPGYDSYFGHGRVDALKALTR